MELEGYYRKTSLIAAFPDQVPSDNPIPFTYDEEGNRVQLYRSEQSSHGRDPNEFILPPESGPSMPDGGKGKEREVRYDQLFKSPDEHT
jgi:hypothetical protein